MKSGVSLQQMLTEVKRQSESKEDYLIAPNRLRMESYGKEMFLHLSDDSGTELIEPMTITGIAHRQIGTHLRIPAAYYDRMREERPDLLAYNANTWFKQESSQRMLRTLDGSARAYLSNRYRRIDNIDIAGVTLPILGGLPDIRFESCQITESRMYIKAVNPRLQAEVSPGDIVQAGVIISNSEVGLGSVSIQPLIYRLMCSNGMVVNEAAARRNHVGRVTDSEENFSVWTAIGLVLLNLVWQLYRCYGAGFDIDTENPINLVVRSVIFLLLIWYCDDIVNLALQIGGTPYSWILDSSLPGVQFGDFNSVLLVIIGVIANGSVALIALILVVVLAWNYLKLLLEAAERYIVLGILVFTAPLAFAMGAARGTNNIFKSWCRMFGGQLLLLVMNAWCLKLFVNMVGEFLANPLSL